MMAKQEPDSSSPLSEEWNESTRGSVGVATWVDPPYSLEDTGYGQRAQPVLTVIAGSYPGLTVPLNSAVISIGRNPDCEIRLNGSGVSRNHLKLVAEADGWVAIDTESTNGVWINGERIKRRQLEDGDRLRLGREAVLKFSYEDAGELLVRMRKYEESIRDDLTGLHNRRFFDSSLKQELPPAVRRASPISVILLDIDRFKRINDRHGHQAGDDVLRGLSASIAPQLRTEDVFARYGGEEFALLLRGQTARQAFSWAERIRQVIQDTKLPVGEELLAVTASLGIATREPHEEAQPDELVAEADRRLYLAKEAGRNRSIGSGTIPNP